MKKISLKSKVFLILQIVFMILTFVGGILLFIGKVDNAGMAVCSMVISLTFGSLFNLSMNKKWN